MKKFYEKAEMEIVEFDVEDVITVSGDIPIDPSDVVDVEHGDGGDIF